MANTSLDNDHESNSKIADKTPVSSHICNYCKFMCEDVAELVQHQKLCQGDIQESRESHVDQQEVLRYEAANGSLNHSIDRLHGYPVFHCDDCEYETFSLATLSSHQKTHNMKKLFQCDVCHMKFSQAANMRRHRMRHSGIKPFECRECLKRFFRKDHLMEHMVTHSKQLPFQCPICGKSFHRQVHLKEHISSEHSGVLADRVCNICGHKAATIKGAKLHFTTRHTRFRNNISVLNNDRDSFNLNSISMSLVTSSTVTPPSSLSHDLHSDPVSSTGVAKTRLASICSESDDKINSSFVPHSLFSYMRGGFSDYSSKLNVISDSTSVMAYPNIMSLVVESRKKPLSLPSINVSSAQDKKFATASIVSYQRHIHGKTLQTDDNNDNDVTCHRVSLADEKMEKCISKSGIIIKQETSKFVDSDECSEEHSISGDPNQNSEPLASPDNAFILPALDSSRMHPALNGFVDHPLSDASTSGTTSPTPLPNDGLRCHYCGIIYPDQTLYFLHKGLHSDMNPWKCNICGETCNDKYDFNVHILSKPHQ